MVKHFYFACYSCLPMGKEESKNKRVFISLIISSSCCGIHIDASIQVVLLCSVGFGCISLGYICKMERQDRQDNNYIKRQINMDTSLVLFTSFVALLGLQMCVPENPNGRFEAQMNERYWTQNPLLRIFYGLSNIAGVIFVLGMVAYLTISEHWWYLIVYLVALPMAKLLAFICKLGVLLLWKKSDNIETFCRIKKHRIVGSLVIITAIITFFFNL